MGFNGLSCVFVDQWADIGVRASIVNDGNGNRLVFSSENSGAGNALEVTVADDDGNNSNTNGHLVLVHAPETGPRIAIFGQNREDALSPSGVPQV